jgi:3-oxoacyl-[acyl-carrier-protein] synthase-3
MAFFRIDNIRISGIAAGVPEGIEENARYPFFSGKDLETFIATTGIERKRKVTPGVCTSDLCLAAAEALIADLGWNKEEISILAFVTQSPDYILPATSPILQHKLGLDRECYTLDISLGCSGWVHGVSVVSALMANTHSPVGTGGCKALLMVGDTGTHTSFEDKSAYPLFGDAGAVTALEYHPGAESLLFGMNSDGEGHEAIIVRDGGSRNPFTAGSLEKVVRGEGVISNNLEVQLDGMNVFSFGIREAPKSVNRLLETFNLDKESVDYFTFHQANLMMNEQIRKKLKLPAEKVPYSLKNFGNTSSASIPLTLVTELQKDLSERKLRHIACGFGVGLSWGSMYFTTDHIVCPNVVEV